MKSYKIVILAAVLALSAACAKKDDSGNSVATPDTALTELHARNWVQSFSMAASYVSASDPTAFQNAAVGLARTGMTNTNAPVGTISNINGVTVYGHVVVDATGYVKPNTSFIEVKIDDTYSQSGQYSPILIQILGTSGKAKAGVVDLVFADARGNIHLVGNYDVNNPQGEITGTLRYTVAGGSEVILGQYRIKTCGIIDCSQ